MRLCKLLIVSPLALVTGYAAPVNADVTFTINRAAVKYRCWQDGWTFSRYESTRAAAMTYDHCTMSALSTVCLTRYGSVACDAPDWAGWNAEYTTEVDVICRWTYGVYVGAETKVRGRRRDDAYSDAMPGCVWVSAGIAGTIQPNLTYWNVGEWQPPPVSFACEGAENLDATVWHVPLSASIDYLFYWWRLHGFGNPTFAVLPLELGIPVETWSGRADVTIRTYPDPPYQPPTWPVCRERADITITLPTAAEVAERDCADFNGDGVRSVPDLFSFLSAWFSADVRADRTGDAACEFEDIAAYLGEWFGGV